MTAATIATLSAFAALACASTAHAQTPRQPVQMEARTDAIFSRWTAVQGGIGVTFPAGLYVRSGAVIAAGGGGRGFDSRLDVFSRFNLDPFRESHWGFYGGAGLSGRYTARDYGDAHVFLLVFVGMEGPLRAASIGGWAPAVELGLGGGARIGIALRQGIRGRR